MSNKEHEILKALVLLAKRGPVEAIGSGPNAVGKTLQEYLGISHSTTSRNTFHGYTVTATKSLSNSSGRTNLFACVPSWDISNKKSSKEILVSFGREDLDRGYAKSLFCTTTSLGPNGFGLTLKVDASNKSLEEWHVSGQCDDMVVAWDVSRLEAKLANLGDVAIITALPIDTGEKLSFQFRHVDLLSQPNIDGFLDLLDSGIITIDHCLSMKVGTEVAREQGPLFKITANARDELYGEVKRYDLLDLRL
jgi:hypothetical protein